MNLALLLRLVRRELRGARGRAASFAGALAVGVAAVVLVAGLGDGVQRALRMEGRPLLGADVVVRSFQPLPEDVADVAATVPGVERLDSVDLVTMAAAPGADGGPGRSLLTELKAVEPGWPFYGAPELDPPRPLAELLAGGGVVVERALLERLDLAVGDRLRLGTAELVIRGVVLREPGRLPTGLSMGPRVFVARDTLAAAGLGAAGARITHRALLRAPDEAAANTLAAALQARLAGRATVETWSDAQPSTRRSVENATRWLGLVALLALLVGGVGVAQATRAWMARRLDAVAVQRTLGLTRAEVAWVGLLQVAALAALGSLVGVSAGTAALAAAPALLGGLLPEGAVLPWQPAAAARGAALGLATALLFSAWPLWQAARVPPLRVLRRDLEPLPLPWPAASLLGAAVLGGVFGLAWSQGEDPLVAAAFVGAVAAVTGLGAAGAGLAARALGVLAPRLGPWWLRHGLAALGRPGAGLVPAVVSLGIGVVVVLTTVLVEGRLYARTAQELPETAPTAFLVDVQPDQRAGVEALLTSSGGERIRGAPVVVGRLAAVDGVGVAELAARLPEADRWQLTREQRISYAPALPAGNTIVAGEPFSDAVNGEVSVEERYAEGLGAKVGSVLAFDVQGVPVELRVANLRRVSWESFEINFFLLAEAGVLDGAPQTVLMTTQLPAERETAAQDALAARFPNVVLVSVRSALGQARGLLEKLGQGIRAVGGFTALAGLAILATGVAADAARRGRQVALLKTLGTTRAGVAGLLAVEYALVGLLAGGLGAVGAVGLSWVIVTQLLRLDWVTDLAAVGLAVGGTGLLAALVGVAANTVALQVRPAEVLRGE